VILLFMESFRAADIGVLGGRHNASPNFDRLSREGVLFSRFYATGVQTARGAISSLFGILPRFSTVTEQSGQPDLPLIGIADLFNRRGYTNAYFQGGALDFERQDEFFPRHGYAQLHGAEQIGAAFPDAPRTSWGIHDEYLMRYAVDWLQQSDRRQQPACLTMFTISNHHPWEIPPGYQTPQFEAQGEYARFLQSFHYADHCLGLLVDLLREQGLDRRTVLFVLADTSTPMGEHHDNFMLVRYLYEENLRIPLLIMAPGRVEPTVVDDLGSQVDLLPTVMDLFGMTGLNHAVGTSLVRRVPDRTVHFNSPFTLQYLGLRRGELKYLYTVRSRESAVFDLQTDPTERSNLAGQSPAVAAELRSQALAVNRLFARLYLEQRFVGRQEGQP
jgi:phosphoglycerol transferase MdoB-like AlkP superfamily enzyme